MLLAKHIFGPQPDVYTRHVGKIAEQVEVFPVTDIAEILDIQAYFQEIGLFVMGLKPFAHEESMRCFQAKNAEPWRGGFGQTCGRYPLLAQGSGARQAQE